MATLQRMPCSSCGGVIDPYKLFCNSCGMQYRLDHGGNVVRVETCNKELIYINEGVAVDAFCLEDPNVAANVLAQHTMYDLVEKLAERILPLVEFQTTYMPYSNSYLTHARLAVAKPQAEYTIHYGNKSDILGYGDPTGDRPVRAVVHFPTALP